MLQSNCSSISQPCSRLENYVKKTETPTHGKRVNRQGLGQPYMQVRPFRTVCRAKRPSRTPCLFRCQLCIARPRGVFGFGRLQHDVPEWLQPFTEGMWKKKQIHQAEMNNVIQNHFLHNHLFQRDPEENTIYSLIFQKTPNCDAHKRTKITRAPCRKNPEIRDDRPLHATQFGDTSAAVHKILELLWAPSVHHRSALGQGKRYSDSIRTPSHSLGVSRIDHIPLVHGHATCKRNELLTSTMRLGTGPV